MECILTFLNTVLTITTDEKSDGLMENVIRFFSTHFSIDFGKKDGSALATIKVSRVKEPKQFFQTSEKVDNLYIRKSASDFFSIFVEKRTTGGIEYFYSKEANVSLVYHKELKNIEVYCSFKPNQREEMILIELIRDLVLKNEELHGSIVVHAASAEKNGEVILITGPKGAGKSTVLLELVRDHGYNFFSGDKTFLWVKEDCLMAKGWPDYPHLGLGTISKYPELVAKLSLEDEVRKNQATIWSTRHKMPVPPEVLADFVKFSSPEKIAKLKKIIMPSVQKEIALRMLETSTSIEMLQKNIEIVRNHWNNYLDMSNRNVYDQSLKEVLSCLKGIPTVDLFGNGKIKAKFLC